MGITRRKYDNFASKFPCEEVFDKKGNKLFGLSKTPKEELFDKNKNKFLIFGRKVMYGK